MKTESPQNLQANETLLQQVIRSRAIVLGILFLVTGFLGLPLLWASPAFSKSGKWFWSVVVTIYTLLLIAGTVAVVWWAYSTIVG